MKRKMKPVKSNGHAARGGYSIALVAKHSMSLVEARNMLEFQRGVCAIQSINPEMLHVVRLSDLNPKRS